MLSLRPALLALGLALGCATAPKPSAPATEANSAFVPTPYTAAQIREATSVGRTYEWRMEIMGQPTKRHVATFTKVSDANAEMSVFDLDEQGKELAPPKVSVNTWEELRQHAQFARDAVEMGEEQITVPAGTFDCLRYTVTKGEAAGMTFYFAKSLPGAPVLFFKSVNGTKVMTSSLVRHARGGTQ